VRVESARGANTTGRAARTGGPALVFFDSDSDSDCDTEPDPDTEPDVDTDLGVEGALLRVPAKKGPRKDYLIVTPRVSEITLIWFMLTVTAAAKKRKLESAGMLGICMVAMPSPLTFSTPWKLEKIPVLVRE
jgi:hypothetical protein